MDQTLIVRGRYAGRTFIPNEPLPDAEGTAELVITPAGSRPGGSVADAFGTAPVLRSGAIFWPKSGPTAMSGATADLPGCQRRNPLGRRGRRDPCPLATRLASSLGVPRSLVTSRLTRLECRTRPLRAGDLTTLAQFDVFLAGVELVLFELSPAVIERATDLRAKYNLKTPDALHYATAVEAGAVVFLTGDRALSRCSEVRVELL